MSASYAAPLYGTATRTLPQAAATTMGAVQPTTAAQHLPPIPLADLRPVDPRTQYGLALAARAPAVTGYIPVAQPVPTMDSGLRNLGAAARPKTWWGIF
jgi:hypothetical protein